MTRRVLVFNGDADGLCAAQQLRLSGFMPDAVVTGVKRDIGLLARVDPAADLHVAVADISLDANRDALLRLLDAGARVDWYDHHFAGEIPPHAGLDARIETDPARCSALIVDTALGGRFSSWAVAAAYGDNLREVAAQRGTMAGLEEAELEVLREFGELLNYNAYGESEADLHHRPADVFAGFGACTDALDYARDAAIVAQLRAGMAEDLALARAVTPRAVGAGARLLMLPADAWARRASGVLANELARAQQGCAHAVLTATPGGYLVSVRAPLARPFGAAALCRRFATGGGREAAAGINHLPEADLVRFEAALHAAFG
ncbi:MAG: acetyltransferase [Burkholderiales bacterium]